MFNSVFVKLKKKLLNFNFSIKYTDETELEYKTDDLFDNSSLGDTAFSSERRPSYVKQSSLDEAEFDFQSFPSINLLFANNSIYLNNNTFPSHKHYLSNRLNYLNPPVPTTTTSSTVTHFSTTMLRVTLHSRKRSVSPTNSTSISGKYGIPQVTCSKDQSFCSQLSSLLNKRNNLRMECKLNKNMTKTSGFDEENRAMQNYFTLPHWSTILQSPLNSSSNQLLDDNSSLSYDLLKAQSSYIDTNNLEVELTPEPTPNPTPIQTPFTLKPNAPITTPTSFGSLSLFPANLNELGEVKPENATNTLIISQSPKVLVSNHQLLVDLCAYTQNNLNLVDEKGGFKFNDDNSDAAENSESEEKAQTMKNKRKLFKSTNSGDLLSTNNSSKAIKSDEMSRDASTARKLNIFTGVNINPADDRELNGEMKKVTNNVYISGSNNENNCGESHDDIIDTNNNSNNNEDLNRQSKPFKINNRFSRSAFPLSSSPAPLRKPGSSLFDFDNSLKDPKSIKNALKLNILNKSDTVIKGDEKNDYPKNEQTNDSSVKSEKERNLIVTTLQPANKSHISKLNKNCKSINIQLTCSQTTLNPMSINPSRLLGSFEVNILFISEQNLL